MGLTPEVFDRAAIESAISQELTSGCRTPTEGSSRRWTARRRDERPRASCAPPAPLFEVEAERLEVEEEGRAAGFGTTQAKADAEIKAAAEQLRADAASLAESAGAAAQDFDHESWQEVDWGSGEGLIRLTKAHHWIGTERLESLLGEGPRRQRVRLSGVRCGQDHGFCQRQPPAGDPGGPSRQPQAAADQPRLASATSSPRCSVSASTPRRSSRRRSGPPRRISGPGSRRPRTASA